MIQLKNIKVETKYEDKVYIVTIKRREYRNAVDRFTAEELSQAFQEFDKNSKYKVAILYGEENFCAGADLKAMSKGNGNRISIDGDGPMGISRMLLKKPVIAAVSGYCVAGGLELALWCDLRVGDETSLFGVFCRRFGVPLIDGGTVRLPRLIGHSRALDMILTGRAVDAKEALSFGLLNRLVKNGTVLEETEKLALEISSFPEECMKNDRLSSYDQFGLSQKEAIEKEFSYGLKTLSTKEYLTGSTKFSQGLGKHGIFSKM